MPLICIEAKIVILATETLKLARTDCIGYQCPKNNPFCRHGAFVAEHVPSNLSGKKGSYKTM